MARAGNLKRVFHQWGGGKATLFTYTHAGHDLCTGLLAALLPFVKEGLGLSYLQSGLLLSAYTITSGISQFPGGWIGDRFRRNIVLAVGLGGVGLSTLAVGLSPTYYPMLAILVIMGIFAGAYHPSALATLSASFEETRRGKAIALHVVGGSIGFTIGPILGGPIAQLLGWRFAFVILSLPALVAVPVILKKFRQLELGSGAKSQRQPSRPSIHSTSIWQTLRTIGIIFLLAIFIHLIAGAAMAFIPVYLVDKHHVAPAYAAMMMGILRGGGIAGSLFGGWLSDRWGRKKAIFLSLIVVGPVLYLFTQLPFNAGLIIALLTFGILRYMTQSTIQPFLMDGVPPQLRATVFGIYFGLSMEGMSLAQPVAGHFMDIFGIAEVFTVIALISVGLSLAALLLARKA